MVLPEVGVRGEQGIGCTDRSRRGQGNPNKHISHYCSFKTGTVSQESTFYTYELILL
jgi:hypothetical protein